MRRKKHNFQREMGEGGRDAVFGPKYRSPPAVFHSLDGYIMWLTYFD
jgi:hypothetical protein